MNHHYMAVVSIDALVEKDLPALLTMRHCSEIFQHAARVDRLMSIYPTLTHPVHATLITGRPAGDTGIVRNEEFGSLRPGQWFNNLSQIHCPTLLHAVKRAGMTSAVCRWPVTANGGDVIDYLVPEVVQDVPGGTAMLEALQSAGAGTNMEDILKANIYCLSNGNGRPGYDIFGALCAADIVVNHRPNLLLTHPGIVDSCRHRYGLYAPQITDALEMVDEWIGLLVQAYRKAGIWDDTDFVVLSDHGQMETARSVCLNSLFVREGLIRLDEKGDVRSVDAYVFSTGLSAQVYIKDTENKGLVERVCTLLCDLLEAGNCGFSQILSAHEAKERYGLYGDFSFVLETDGCTSFSEEISGPLFVMGVEGDYRISKATHGYMPHKGPQPVFLAVGPSFREDARIASASVLDVAPTLARVMEVSLDGTKGQVLDALLN